MANNEKHIYVKLASYDASGNEVVDSSNNSVGNVVIADRPVFPQNQSITGNATVAASVTDNVVIYTSGDLTGYNYHAFENKASTDPIDVYGSLDGVTFNPLVAVTLSDDVTTGGGIKVVDIPVAKLGYVIGKYLALRVLRKGTTNEVQDIDYFHGVM